MSQQFLDKAFAGASEDEGAKSLWTTQQSGSGSL